ncbi:MAG: serine protease [Vulcanimicrobiaceae bacterium]
MLPLVLALAVSALAPAYSPAREAQLSTVTIGGLTASGRSGSAEFGAGEIVARRSDGTLLVLTAKHVIADLSAPHVYLRGDVPTGTWVQHFFSPDGGHEAQVVATARDEDLALVAFRPAPGDRYAIARFGVARPASGTIVGHPYGAAWTTSAFALIDAPSGTLIVRCTHCGPGDSGGGLFDGDGNLAGIVIERQDVVQHGHDVATGVFKAIALAPVQRFVASVGVHGGAATRLLAERAPAARGIPSYAVNSSVWARFNAARGSAGP